MPDDEATVSPYLRQPLRSYADAMRERPRLAGRPGQLEAGAKPEADDPTRPRGYGGNDLGQQADEDASGKGDFAGILALPQGKKKPAVRGDGGLPHMKMVAGDRFTLRHAPTVHRLSA